jgi:predicted metalloprotease
MKWESGRRSDNIVDVRRGGGARRAAGVGGIGMILLFVASMIFGVDLTGLAGLVGGGAPAPSPEASGPNAIDDRHEDFVAAILATTEDVWSQEFAERGARYEAPKLVLFSGAVASACGQASSAVGPFYCPGDNRVYLDTDFFDTMERQLGTRGEFARAYVIAHEVGHHVQNLTGVMEQTMRARQRVSEAEANAVSVRIELQADCLAGIWARNTHARYGSLERGDIESAMDAAARIGDDALQRRSQGYVVPDSFTHGTSEQRQRWFWKGFESGELEVCDTFSTDAL